MNALDISVADHERISAAVRAAEATTDGEIVTVIAPRSDSYHDVGLHYAIAAMLILVALVAGYPGWFTSLATHFFGGWQHHLPAPILLTLLLGAQIIVFLIVRYALAWMPLRMALTPAATKERRVRRQAITLFRAAAEARTARQTAILLYLSEAEKRAEIITDAEINARVAPERWGEAMAVLVDAVHEGNAPDGMIRAIGMIGTILTGQLPKSADNPNELPDRLIEL